MDSAVEHSFIVVDVEGNGQSPPDLVEVACVEVTGGLVHDPATWTVKPPRPITGLVARIHGIHNRDVVDLPGFVDVRDSVADRLWHKWLVAHNASVEVHLLSRELGDAWAPAGVFDTLRLAKALWPSLESYKLEALATHAKLKLPAEGTRHRAMWDVEVTAELFKSLFGKLDGDFGKLRELAEIGGSNDQTALFES